LIRYRNGDRLKKLPGRCSCGSKLPLIGKINGRTTDIIRLPDGGCVPGDFLTTIFDHAPEAVTRFQVVQHKDYSITIRYVPASAESEYAVTEVCAKLKTQFEGINVSAEAVDEIASDRGKIRFVMSEFK
jgi:phenylacetate-CoA ligase